VSIGSTIVVDAHRLDVVLEVSANELDAAVTRTVYRNGALLRTRVRAYASGRPGPRVQTGDYRRGISLQTGRTVGTAGASVPFATVFSTSPQGQRLENGFVGVDSLGRHYHQPAFPHFAPALAEVAPLLDRDLNADVDLIARRIAA
jgi:hypothetical protein